MNRHFVNDGPSCRPLLISRQASYDLDGVHVRLAAFFTLIVPGPPGRQVHLYPIILMELLMLRHVAVAYWVESNPLKGVSDTRGANQFLVCP